jgi:energy-coupling factor transporter ATP-binding protein EcfA2
MSDVKLEFHSDKPYSTKGTLIVFNGNDDEPLYSDTLDIANSKKRKQFISEVTKTCEGIPSEKLEQAILKKVAEIMKEKHKADENPEDEQEIDPLDITPQEVKDAAFEMLKSENLFEQISADIATIGIAGEKQLRVILYVIMTSRLLDKPLSAIVQGASASGKSYIIETVAKLMPPETVVQAHDFSDQALYYLPSGSLIHKVIISGERVNDHRSKDGYAEDNTKAFREMVASGVLRKAVTVTGKGKKPGTEMIEQPGPISYLESSTATNIHDEDSTRLLPLVTDESANQTRRIIEDQRREAKGQTISESKRQGIILRHHTLQRLLRTLVVRIPYIDSISLPETNIATRRTYQQFRFAINSVAFLRQYQKQVQYDRVTSQEYIEADEIDYEIVYGLMNTVLARTYSPLNQQSRDLLQKVLEHTDTNTDFTQKDCEQWCGLSNTTVRRRLSPLESVGIVTVNNENKPYRYKVEHPELADVADLSLPLPEDIAERIAIMSE